jgi:Caspase domain
VAVALAGGLALLTGPTAARAAPVAPELFSAAIVIGSNKSPSPKTADLHYADDDAVQGARTLALLGAESFLLVAPDAETKELFPTARPLGPPTRAALAEATKRAFAKLHEARARGAETRLYFFFAGHGDLAGGRPFLQLEDGRLYRDDVATLLHDSPAHEHHVVIDACHASLFVGDRGAGGVGVAVAPGFSRAGGPRWPNHTGLLTARSVGGKTHEWTEYQAGIFSHEVRSGLLGAADADRDGRITYRELGAFIRRANEAIVNRKYRPDVITQPPDGDPDAVFAELPDGPMVLELDTNPGHVFVDSKNGVRIADLHPAPGARLALRLPTDLGTLYLQEVASEREVELQPRAGRLLLSSLVPSPPRARARGAAHEAFRNLFARAFDASAVRGFDPTLVEALDAGPTPGRTTRPWPWAITATGVVGNAAAIGLGLYAHRLADQTAAASGLERDRLNQDIKRTNRTALVVGAVGVALTVAGIGWLWFSRPEESADE